MASMRWGWVGPGRTGRSKGGWHHCRRCCRLRFWPQSMYGPENIGRKQWRKKVKGVFLVPFCLSRYKVTEVVRLFVQFDSKVGYGFQKAWLPFQPQNSERYDGIWMDDTAYYCTDSLLSGSDLDFDNLYLEFDWVDMFFHLCLFYFFLNFLPIDGRQNRPCVFLKKKGPHWRHGRRRDVNENQALECCKISTFFAKCSVK